MLGGHFRVEVIPGTKGRHIYPMPPRTWRRAAGIMDRYGADQALALLDARAMRALGRGDAATAVRWRDVMAAIHAVIEENPSDGEGLN